ncbi:probable serine/threonine-protein kinase PBL10 [Jatropha curcas]|uniref:probable serine/threonine-protein kinase PBL10 n=1 Tax=Jatropha curcas TaxID=180498 RepID=UPI0009D6869F|nr:probable serine/threonine-protein kinase PBL10 [Jatropha curcas]XP_020535314.1 probable serine/threonine-protein kinase PBL10 [Jatropha curcas]
MGLCFSAENAIKGDSHHDNDGNKLLSKSVEWSHLSVPSTTPKFGQILQSPNLKSFGFSELEEATNDFGPDAVFEEAGFGLAYKGWIDECSLEPSRPDTGMAVAIKMFNQKGCPDRQELLAEIKYMGHLYHPNLVKLIGYCLEGDHRLLVYEFMPNGSLENQLFGGDSQFQPLSWNLRMKIALGAAKCLAFLHDEADIIYRDFKTSKILLDLNYNAKLSDL